MESNKMGTHIRKDIDGVFAKLHTIRRNPKNLQSGIRKAYSTDVTRLDHEAKMMLLRTEIRKNQAVDTIRRFQNC